MRAIVDPNADIAKGFETVVVETKDGRILRGIAAGEDDSEINLIRDDGRILSVRKRSVAETSKAAQSAMPADLARQMSLFDLRDLVEYLSGLK